jgi:CRISPR type III-associated protein (TIGR04423 family)
MTTNDKVISYIKELQNYEGYIQFSDEKIRNSDIFTKEDDIANKLTPTKGFVYEAHFCNGVESISVKQVNAEWFISKTDISNISSEDTQVYFAHGKNVKMAQIWEEKADEFCEGMLVKKLQKVVFAGFVGGES